MRCVLDSWGVLELLEAREPAARQIDEFLTHEASMSWINLGEVMYIVQRRHGPSQAREISRDLRAIVEVRLPDENDIMTASDLKARFAISYADAFAAALSIRMEAPLITGDPELLRDDAPWQYVDVRGT